MKRFYTLLLLVAVALHSWAFEFHDFSYSITYKPAGDEIGKVMIDGLSAEGKANTSLKLKLVDMFSYSGKRYRVTAIAPKAFEGCNNIMSIDCTGATYLESYGESMAENLPYLTTVKLAGGTVKKNAFKGCSSLTSLSLGSVTSIGEGAFANCPLLKQIVIPEQTLFVNPRFIDGCTRLSQISVYPNNEVYQQYGLSLYLKGTGTLIRIPPGYSGATPIIAPNVTEIRGYAMYQCANIKSVDLPYGVQTLGNGVFQGMSSLEWVKIPSTFTSIGLNAFANTPAFTDLYINAKNPPTITATDVFGSNVSRVNLHLGENCVTRLYEEAGWTGMTFADRSTGMGYDYTGHDYTGDEFVDYNIHYVEPIKRDGEQFDGLAEVTRGRNHEAVTGDITIPDYITINDKRYVVSRVGEYAFDSPNEFSIKCGKYLDEFGVSAFKKSAVTSVYAPRVDEIGGEAFVSCTHLQSVKWGSRLNYVGRRAFAYSSLSQDVILPYGMATLKGEAFAGTKIKKLLVPSTVMNFEEDIFAGIGQLEELVVNSESIMTDTTDMRLTFTGTPSTCKVYVPHDDLYMGSSNLSEWKHFAGNFYEGGHDFASFNSFSSIYTMQILGREPVTVDGVTYDGMARYVKNPRIKDATSFEAADTESQEWIDTTRTYLMVGIGARTFENSNVETVTIENISHLNYIGYNAFAGSKIKSITLPKSGEIEVGTHAFYGANDLKEIFVPAEATIKYDRVFFGNNAPDFSFFVPYTYVNNWMKKLKGKDSGQEAYDNTRVAPWFTATNSTFALGTFNPTDFEGSGVKAYAVTGLNNANGLLTTKLVPSTTVIEKGYILTDLTPGETYKIKTLNQEATTSDDNKIKAVVNPLNIKDRANAHYWDEENLKFVRPTENKTLLPGSCYLVMTGGDLFLDILSGQGGKQGDVNGDGTVDVTDVNLTINVMLGKSTKSEYPASDVNGDGTVDVTDVNLIINVMLGK